LKCHSSGEFQNLVPRPDAGERRIDDDPFGDAGRILRGERIADHVADVVGDEIGLVDLERVHHPGDVGALRLLVVAALRLRRQAHAAQVGNDDGVILVKRARRRRPHVAGVAEAMQQHDRRTFAADPDMIGGIARLDAFDAEARGEGLDFGLSR